MCTDQVNRDISLGTVPKHTCTDDIDAIHFRHNHTLFNCSIQPLSELG